jgi:hypothetical protein
METPKKYGKKSSLDQVDKEVNQEESNEFSTKKSYEDEDDFDLPLDDLDTFDDFDDDDDDSY